MSVVAIAAAYGAVVATFAFILAGLSLGWNIVNAIREARARRSPDVHGVLTVDPAGNVSALEFGNSGPGMARHLFYLLVEHGTVYQGAIPSPFLVHDERQKVVVLPFATNTARSTFVWAYMDSDHNVHARSNHGARYVYKHPARVEIGETFQRFYPHLTLPERPPFPLLGEL
ncbi:MAG: hypothetical protein WKF65_04875 [Gaiellaceae bacterium]